MDDYYKVADITKKMKEFRGASRYLDLFGKFYYWFSIPYNRCFFLKGFEEAIYPLLSEESATANQVTIKLDITQKTGSENFNAIRFDEKKMSKIQEFRENSSILEEGLSVRC